MNERERDRIHDLKVDINGFCDAADLLIDDAVDNLRDLQEIDGAPSVFVATIKSEIFSVQFMIMQIKRAAEAVDDVLYPGNNQTEADTYTPEDIKRAIGTPSLIKAARMEKGFTEEQLAELAGVTPDAIRAYEAGDRVPRDEIKVKLAAALERPVQDLFFLRWTP